MKYPLTLCSLVMFDTRAIYSHKIFVEYETINAAYCSSADSWAICRATESMQSGYMMTIPDPNLFPSASYFGAPVIFWIEQKSIQRGFQPTYFSNLGSCNHGASHALKRQLVRERSPPSTNYIWKCEW